jgi:hypothetical protein
MAKGARLMARKRTLKDKKKASFTTWKLTLENTVNADPLTDGACLQVLRAYLDYMGSPDARPYRSIIDLQVATALSENTITSKRRKLESLGYFQADGKTSDGATRYKISNVRENIVLDHQTVARETLRKLEAERRKRPERSAKQLVCPPQILRVACPPLNLRG